MLFKITHFYKVFFFNFDLLKFKKLNLYFYKYKNYYFYLKNYYYYLNYFNIKFLQNYLILINNLNNINNIKLKYFNLIKFKDIFIC